MNAKIKLLSIALGLSLLGAVVGGAVAWTNVTDASSVTLRPNASLASDAPPASASTLSGFIDHQTAARPPLQAASASFVQAWEISRALASTSVATPKPPGWRIVGTTVVSGTQSVLVAYEGVSAPEAKLVGDRLPGGAQILGIDGTSVLILLNGKRVYLNTMN